MARDACLPEMSNPYYSPFTMEEDLSGKQRCAAVTRRLTPALTEARLRTIAARKMLDAIDKGEWPEDDETVEALAKLLDSADIWVRVEKRRRRRRR